MCDIKYGIVEETYRCEDTYRRSYGIAAYNTENGVGDVFASIHDISSDREKVHRLASRCNELGLDLIHLQDVVIDFLCD